MFNIIINTIKSFFEVIFELVFPERNICFICDRYDEDIKDKHICEDCDEKLTYIKKNYCSKCGRILSKFYIRDICEDCTSNKFCFDKAISVFEYGEIIKESIYKFKYKNKAYMYRMFGYCLVQAINENNIENIDIVVGVPLHKKKKIKRGFNQSELLGRYIKEKLDIDMDTKSLVRIKNTAIQNKLNRSERSLNLKNAFDIKNKDVFKNKRVLLVDDIFTTGSTVNEICKVLKKTQPKEIIVLTISTGKTM